MYDILIFSQTFGEYLSHIQLIFNAFKEDNIKLKLSKCKFAEQKVTFLEYVITYNKYYAENSNIDAIKKLERPKSLKQLIKSIPNLSIILNPLYKAQQYKPTKLI